MLEKPATHESFLTHTTESLCTECDARLFCIAGGLDKSCAEALCGIIRRKGPYQAGERVYRRGMVAKTIFVVERGSVKLETVTRDGRRLVGGFLFAGELLGIDGMGRGRYPADAFALQETSLCALPLDELETLCRKIPELQKNFLRRLGGELSVSRYECSSLRQEASHLRTLAFLRELHERQSNQTNSRSREVHLPMSKQDIACYLGLTPESLSRSLKKLEKQGLVRNSLRSITLL